MPGHRFQTAPTAPSQLRFIVRVNEFVLQRLKGSSLAVRQVQAAWAISAKRRKKKTQCAISASLFAEMCSERICPHMQTLLRLLSVFVLVAVLHYSFFSVRTNVEAVICRLLTSFDYIIISQKPPHLSLAFSAATTSIGPFSCFLADVYDATVRRRRDPTTFSGGRCNSQLSYE